MKSKRQNNHELNIITLDELELQDVRDEALRVPSRFLAFLNCLPQSQDLRLAERLLATGLKELLQDIDHVIVKVNYGCGPRRFDPLVQRKGVQPSGSRSKGRVERTQIPKLDVPPCGRVAEAMQEWNVNPSDYKWIESIDYFHHEGTYLGTITLLRQESRYATTSSTEESLNILKPVLEFALSDLILGELSQESEPIIDSVSLNSIIKDACLTRKDEQILYYLFNGYTYQKTADRLGISIETIKKHMKRIYSKTGTDSLSALFARYFSQRLPR